MSTQPPKPGICSSAHVSRVIDGDTLEVVITKLVRVRLLDCYSPELSGPQKEDGIAARDYCQKLIDEADPQILLQVPTSTTGALQDILTLNRVLGEIWLKMPDGTHQSLARLLVNAGHATPTKSH